MNNMNQKRLINILLVIWILIIWGNSLMPGDVSSSQSGFVVGLFTYVLDLIKISYNEVTLSSLIRSVAHFTEFFILGMILVLRFKNIFISYGIGLVIIFTDEIIQIFVPGRAFEVKDLIVDTFGLNWGILIVAGIIYLIKRNQLKSLE
ncbi:MAG: hypothetical protein A2Y45_00870 [Tenericutes bacterium GWC2_34_14]|nr:MAG: hypothetical protein A2Y45_00870 [Tenericutes bacterium GWC2_34_14]OHE34546.1 MAG: hypothetical protein A2012_08490 [Tenericutes bacterium GWE2_34_108]OHE35903.1 MAG: hypothetical protein A2Y46_03195 [Tenericutes bacterium GWF1_35_14]OHE39011.1 MAG: hypothetical protein A2Y44_06735 [Tenericutes bacterium GWF2_35_184]OHE42454.1 MAG: hypothetical protein A3K26_07435 [Tenericutes bacterium RIFOXYA12_FULL_35_10]OHE42921.1 MAG: hypothetical protein A2221_09500 [Tenericutes bacterium RIFOXYA